MQVCCHCAALFRMRLLQEAITIALRVPRFSTKRRDCCVMLTSAVLWTNVYLTRHLSKKENIHTAGGFHLCTCKCINNEWRRTEQRIVIIINTLCLHYVFNVITCYCNVKFATLIIMFVATTAIYDYYCITSNFYAPTLWNGFLKSLRVYACNRPELNMSNLTLAKVLL